MGLSRARDHAMGLPAIGVAAGTARAFAGWRVRQILNSLGRFGSKSRADAQLAALPAAAVRVRAPAGAPRGPLPKCRQLRGRPKGLKGHASRPAGPCVCGTEPKSDTCRRPVGRQEDYSQAVWHRHPRLRLGAPTRREVPTVRAGRPPRLQYRPASSLDRQQARWPRTRQRAR